MKHHASSLSVPVNTRATRPSFFFHIARKKQINKAQPTASPRSTTFVRFISAGSFEPPWLQRCSTTWANARFAVITRRTPRRPGAKDRMHLSRSRRTFEEESCCRAVFCYRTEKLYCVLMFRFDGVFCPCEEHRMWPDDGRNRCLPELHRDRSCFSSSSIMLTVRWCTNTAFSKLSDAG